LGHSSDVCNNRLMNVRWCQLIIVLVTNRDTGIVYSGIHLDAQDSFLKTNVKVTCLIQESKNCGLGENHSLFHLLRVILGNSLNIENIFNSFNFRRKVT